jgi:hypothetical protein
LLDIKAISKNHQDVAFIVTIVYLDDTVIWAGTTENNKIIYQQLNRLDINVTKAGKVKYYFIEKYVIIYYLNSRWLFM